MIADEIIEPRRFLEVYTIVTKLILTGSRLTVKRNNYNAPKDNCGRHTRSKSANYFVESR